MIAVICVCKSVVGALCLFRIYEISMQATTKDSFKPVVPVMHHSFQITPTPFTCGEVQGTAGLKCGAITFIVPAVQGKWQGFDVHGSLPQGVFLLKGTLVLASILSRGRGVGYIAGHCKLKSHNPRPSP